MDLLTVRVAAELLGETPRHLRYLLSRLPDLASRRIGRDWAVDRADFPAIRARRRNLGRAKKRAAVA